ncbi:MAG: hypothetical protein HY268_10540 [Deltaproteobacteria bacterium]|nr:hypothetical protein [Deltaproteobacteria bacterium]
MDKGKSREDTAYRSPSLDAHRYYMEKFLSAHSSDIYGRVLEIENNAYTGKFGGDRVTKSDVLHVVAGNPQATILTEARSENS